MKATWIGSLIGIVMSIAITQAHAEIKIGVAGPLTGTAQGLGEQSQAGAQKAVADINANGGLLGQQVVAIYVDDACDPKQGEAAARQLVSQGVVFVDGHVCSAASLAASPIYEAAGIVMISVSATQNSPSKVDQTCFVLRVATISRALSPVIIWPRNTPKAK